MKKLLEGFVLLVALVVLVGCGISRDRDITDISPTYDIKIPFENIAQGTLLGDMPHEPAYLVIDSPSKWDQAQELLPEQVIVQARIEGEIDDFALVAYAGVKNSSGYTIEIKSVTLKGGDIEVIVSETLPNEVAIVEPATTLPFHVISLLKDNLGTNDTYTLYFKNEKDEVLETIILHLE